MTKLKAPQNAGPVHWRGKVYDIRRDGSAVVPDEAAVALRAHGFMPWRETDAARTKREG